MRNNTHIRYKFNKIVYLVYHNTNHYKTKVIRLIKLKIIIIKNNNNKIHKTFLHKMKKITIIIVAIVILNHK
jgi:hypothetical protein